MKLKEHHRKFITKTELTEREREKEGTKLRAEKVNITTSMVTATKDHKTHKYQAINGDGSFSLPLTFFLSSWYGPDHDMDVNIRDTETRCRAKDEETRTKIDSR